LVGRTGRAAGYNDEKTQSAQWFNPALWMVYVLLCFGGGTICRWLSMIHHAHLFLISNRREVAFGCCSLMRQFCY
jgi:hypothetical protein